MSETGKTKTLLTKPMTIFPQNISNCYPGLLQALYAQFLVQQV